MKVTVFIIIIFLLSVPNAHAFDEEKTYEEIKKYLFFENVGVSEKKLVENLDNISNKINEELIKYPEKVELLSLKGLSFCSYLYAKKDLDLHKVNEYKSSCQMYLRKAITANRLTNSLTVDQLFTIKSYSGSGIIVDVIAQILITDHHFDDKERVELRRNKIDHLIRLSRFDEALDEMKMLNEKFPEYASKEWDDAFLGEIQKVKELKEGVAELEKIKVPEVKPEAPKTQTPIAEVKLVETKPKPTPSKIEEPTVEVTEHKMWYLALLALILLAVCTVLLRRR